MSPGLGVERQRSAEELAPNTTGLKFWKDKIRNESMVKHSRNKYKRGVTIILQTMTIIVSRKIGRHEKIEGMKSETNSPNK